MAIDIHPENPPGRTPIEAGSSAAMNAAHNMEAGGGSFARAIGLAYYRADLSNQRKLVEAFQDLFWDYSPEGRRA